MSRTLVYDIEVAFYPDITEMAMKRGVDEKQFSTTRFGSVIDANMRYVTHISYKIDNEPVVDLSLLDGKGSLRGDANELGLLLKFIKVYNSCDEAAAHYGSRFDLKFLNSRISLYGLAPLKPIKMIDTWRILKDKFLLINNRLEIRINGSFTFVLFLKSFNLKVTKVSQEFGRNSYRSSYAATQHKT